MVINWKDLEAELDKDLEKIGELDLTDLEERLKVDFTEIDKKLKPFIDFLNEESEESNDT